MFCTHVCSVTDGSERKKQELGCNRPIQPHVDHEASFAFCRGTFLTVTPSAHSTQPNIDTAALGKSANIPLQDYHFRKANCDVESYRRHRGQFSALSTLTTLQHTYPSNSSSLHNTTEMFSYRTHQPSLQTQAGDPISEVQNSSGL